MNFESPPSPEEETDSAAKPEKKPDQEKPDALEDPNLIIEAVQSISDEEAENTTSPPPREEKQPKSRAEKTERPRIIRTLEKSEIRQKLVLAVEGIISTEGLDKMDDWWAIREIVKRLAREAVEGRTDITTIDGLEELWHSEEFLRTVIGWRARRAADVFISENIKNEKVVKTDEERAITEKLFGVMGLDIEQGQDIIDCCASISRGKDSVYEKAARAREAIEGNLRAMLDLELDSPGSVSKLYREYGIRQFYRYPKESLVRQSEGQAIKPLRVAFTSSYDHNGAFSNVGQRISGIDGQDERIYVEGSSLMEAARRLLRLSRRHGSIVDLVVAAHGNRQIMRLGSNSLLSKSAVEKSKGMRRMIDRGIFSREIFITLFSCNTGKRGGIGKSLADTIGTQSKHVRAPRVKSEGIPRVVENKLFYKTHDPVGPGKLIRKRKRTKRFSKAAEF